MRHRFLGNNNLVPGTLTLLNEIKLLLRGEVGMLAKELADILMKNPDMKVETTVHILVPEKELEQRGYKYPWDNWNVELDIDDIGYSDNVILLGCHIEN